MSTIKIFGQVIELANLAATIKKWVDAQKLTPQNAPLPNSEAFYGGDLDLSGLTSIPDGFNPTVGGGLDSASSDLLAGWLASYLDTTATRART